MDRDYILLQNYVNDMFVTRTKINHELISQEFMEMLKDEFSDERFEKLLIIAGYIPDIYPNDSSEETLFTKLIEGLVCEWSRRMGFESELIKQKASMEDIKIIINDKVIVCDAKSFRLGRSQQAPNAKDFLKLEDIRKWMDRYEKAIGGLVTYPCTHEWKTSSDIYQYCSTKDAPTVMLPYKYLAYLLSARHRFKTQSIIELWDYMSLFPSKLDKKMIGGNKNAYWEVINKNIIRVTDCSEEDFTQYMQNADKLIRSCIKENLRLLEEIKLDIVKSIKDRVDLVEDVNQLKEIIIKYQTETETELLDKLINRIKNFRL